MPSVPTRCALALAVGETAATIIPSVPIHRALFVSLVAGKLGFLARATSVWSQVLVFGALLDGVVFLCVLSCGPAAAFGPLAVYLPAEVDVHLARFGLTYIALARCALAIAVLLFNGRAAKRNEQMVMGFTSEELAALEPPVQDDGYFRRPTPKFSDAESLSPVSPGPEYKHTFHEEELEPKNYVSETATTPDSSEVEECAEPMLKTEGLEEHSEATQQGEPEDADDTETDRTSMLNLDTRKNGPNQTREDMRVSGECPLHDLPEDDAREHELMNAWPVMPTNEIQRPEPVKVTEIGDFHVRDAKDSEAPAERAKHNLPPSAFEHSGTSTRPSTKGDTSSAHTTDTYIQRQHAKHVSFDQAIRQSTNSAANFDDTGNALGTRHTSGNLRKLRLTFGRHPSGEHKTHQFLGALRHRTVSRTARQSVNEGVSNAASKTDKRSRRSSRVVSVILGDRKPNAR